MSFVEDWTESCRGCLVRTSLVSILDSEEIWSKFHEITSISVKEGDCLPAYLCLDCLDSLNFMHQFKKECLKIDSDIKVKLTNKVTTSSKKRKIKMELMDVNSIKQESLSDDEMDDNAYYVVIIDEENGEKVVKAIKIENTDDTDDVLENIKQERQDLITDVGDLIDPIDGHMIVPETEPMEEMQSQFLTDNKNNILRESDEDMTEGRLNLMHVLADNDSETNNIISYDDEMHLVGEVITGELNEQENSAYTDQEVIVGNLDGEYHIITADGEIAVLGDDEETITVMQQEDGSFLCECGEAYMEFTDYENHVKIHNIYKCNICEKGFESNEILEGHILLHKSNEGLLSCPFCTQIVKRGLLTTHIKLNHNQIRHFCKICKKSFATEPNLKRHMQIHNKYRKFECNICFKRFTQKNLMETHRLTHEEAFLKCALCSQDFGTEEECIQHQKEGCVLPPSEERGTDKPHVCDVCGKSYATPNSLKAHMENAHNTQNLEILCSECGEVLPSRKAMYAHSWAHKQGKLKNMKRFSCETCGKGCASHAMLLMHERVHTNERPFQCAKCPLAFKTKTHLTTHQLTHTQEKRFGCSVCMKFFALKGNLVVHLRTHTGERPYVCSICNQGFIDSKYLKKHKQKRHDIANIPWNQYY